MKIDTLCQRERAEERLGYLGTRIKEKGRLSGCKCLMKIPLASTKVKKKTARRRVLIRPESDTQLSWRVKIKDQRKKVALFPSLHGFMAILWHEPAGVSTSSDSYQGLLA